MSNLNKLVELAELLIRDLEHKALSKGLPVEQLDRWDRMMYQKAKEALAGE